MLKANWNCEICRGFGVVDFDACRGESRLCPRCSVGLDPDPDPVAVAQPGPFSVWHVHGDEHDPERALSRGNFDRKGDAMVRATHEADEYDSGKLVVYANNGKPVFVLNCPLTRMISRYAA